MIALFVAQLADLVRHIGIVLRRRKLGERALRYALHSVIPRIGTFTRKFCSSAAIGLSGTRARPALHVALFTRAAKPPIRVEVIWAFRHARVAALIRPSCWHFVVGAQATFAAARTRSTAFQIGALFIARSAFTFLLGRGRLETVRLWVICA